MENMMEILRLFHVFRGYILLIGPHIPDVFICHNSSSSQWRRSFSRCLSLTLHVCHDVFTQSVSIVIYRILLLSKDKPFSTSTNLKNILAQVFFMNKLKYRWVETNLLLQHIVTITAKMAIRTSIRTHLSNQFFSSLLKLVKVGGAKELFQKLPLE